MDVDRRRTYLYPSTSISIALSLSLYIYIYIYIYICVYVYVYVYLYTYSQPDRVAPFPDVPQRLAAHCCLLLLQGALPPSTLDPGQREREFFMDNLLVRVYSIIVMIRWTGLAPWEFKLTFPGSLTSSFLVDPRP